MSLDMLSAEHQGYVDLGGDLVDDLGPEDDLEQDVSMMAHEALDEISFDAEDGPSGHHEDVDKHNNHVDDDPSTQGQDVDYTSPEPSDIPLEPKLTVGEADGAAVEPADSHASEHELDAAEAPEGSKPHRDSEAASGLLDILHPSPPGGDDLVSEIDFDRNDEAQLEEVEEPAEVGTVAQEASDKDEAHYEQVQGQGQAADLEHEASNSEPSQDRTHPPPPSGDADVAGQGGDGGSYYVEANEEDHSADFHNVDSEPGGHDAVADERAEVPTDHDEEGLSVSHQEEQAQDHEDEEGGVEYMDVTELDPLSDEFSLRPLVRIRYRDTTYSLFSASNSDDPYSYFLEDVEALDYPLSQFIAGLRDVLSEELTPDEELVIRIDGLGLEFSENMDKSSLDRTTFGRIVDLYDRLAKADDPTSQELVLLAHLVTRPNTMRRLETLLDGANIGEGLSAYHLSYPDYLLRDFPPKGHEKGSLDGHTSLAEDGDEDGQLDSDLDVDDADEHDDVEEADHHSPQHTTGSPSWHEAEGEEENDRNLPGDSDGQVTDETHEVPAHSKRSASPQVSSKGLEDHETGSGLSREQPPEPSAHERIESEVLSPRSPQASEQANPSPNANAGFQFGDIEGDEVQYDEHAEHTDSNEQELYQIDGLFEEGQAVMDQDGFVGDGDDSGGDDLITGEPPYTGGAGDGLGQWDDENRDAGASAPEDSGGHLESPVPSQHNDAEDDAVEAHAQSEVGDNEWDADGAEAEPDVPATDGQNFEMIQHNYELSAGDASHPADSEQTSASGTLNGDEIDIEEVLGGATPAPDGSQPNEDSGDYSNEGQSEADEIDWDDNDNEAAVADPTISTPSSITGKRPREVDDEDAEGSGDEHDVKRHRV